ncbi:MAG: hypothetical protein ACE5LU_10300 [Anaerolineae bacterium]
MNHKWPLLTLIVPLILTLSTFAVTSKNSEQPTPTASERLVIVDANGKKVGKVIGIDHHVPQIALEINGHLFTLGVRENRFAGQTSWNSGVLFESEDCTGTPYIRDDRSALPSVVVNVPGNTVYIEDPAASVQTIAVRSRYEWMSPWEDPPTCSPVTWDNEEAVQAIPLINLDTVFTPPFSIHSAPCPDFDGDGKVTVIDITEVAKQWGMCP